MGFFEEKVQQLHALFAHGKFNTDRLKYKIFHKVFSNQILQNFHALSTMINFLSARAARAYIRRLRHGGSN